MLKLIVLFGCVAYVLAGVLPKQPPAAHHEESESPSVKKVPLHPGHHQSMDDLKKTELNQHTKTEEPKKTEEKSVKKEEHEQPSVKKAVEHDSGHGGSLYTHAKLGNIHSLGHTVKVASKDEMKEAAKAKPAEKSH